MTRSELWIRLLRALIYAVAAYVGVYPLAVPMVAASAAAAAATGALLGSSGFAHQLRPRAVASLLGLGLLAGAGLRTLLAGSELVATALGPLSLLRVSQAAQAVLWALSVGFGLRALSARYAFLRVLEIGLVGAACAQPVIAHRGGAINRPFELADAILAVGGDPTVAFLAIGTAATALVVTLLLGERRPLRALLQVALVAGLLALLARGAPMPEPSAAGLLSPGKGKHDGSKRKGKGGQGQSDGERRRDEELEFRDNYDNSGKQVPLAVVLLHDDYSPPSGMYYFRQTAFSQFNGRRLVMATRDDADRDVAPTFVSDRVEVDGVAGRSVDRRPLATTVALLADHTRPFALESLVALEPAPNHDPGRFRRVYRTESAVLVSDFRDLLSLSTRDPTWEAPLTEHYLGLPDDARYGELADKIIETLPSGLRSMPVARALSVSRYLSEEGIYSLRSKHADAEDPTADFLFGDLTGYCVHFAHAAVYLMRAMGVPARVGAGYVIEEAARQGGSALLLTGANAHAWPEIYIDGVGWVVADVSPEQALDPPPPPPDPDLQRLLGEMARGLRPLPATADNVLQPVVHVARELYAALRAGVVYGVPIVLLMFYLVKLWRRLAPRFGRERALPRLAYRAQLDRLSELSLRRSYGESREAFAARVAGRFPGFSKLTAVHVAAAFRPEGQAVARNELRLLERAARSELSRAAPSWRRALGWLTPWSFLLSR
ncbi:MAG: transglutaminase domain-containing protein [Myxococcales bacterium]|nr:transglutaminase domain-containing protein [Myxococcales bacterium]MDD9970083.1 transglutaminase domain-containing protein [Myxococcales bacterium]